MHKRALVGLTVFVTLAGIVAVLRLTDRPVTGESFELGTLRSAVLGEDRPFVVSLPESYAREPGRRYPVAYVLDGDEQLTQTAESAAKLQLAGLQIGQMAVSRIDTGKRVVPDFELPVIAGVLGVSTDWLLGKE